MAGRALPGQDSPSRVVQTFRRKEPDPTGQAWLARADGQVQCCLQEYGFKTAMPSRT
ncbi:MAG: hypothetical protein ACYS19_20035 [Planctomycetota bacterium]